MQRVTLGEGRTPLVESRRIAANLGLGRLHFKLESCNPSGSYKDRFIAAELEGLLRTGVRSCVATSSGNTGASLAAYCARYQVACTIVVGDATPAGKLVQMQAHGARLIRVKDFTVDAAVTAGVMDTLAEYSKRAKAALVVSAYRYCPNGMAGVETVGREILEQIAKPSRHVFVPAGSGGLYVATARGIRGSSRVHAVQPAGCSTFVASMERGDSAITPVASTTRISGLSVPFDIDASLALAELRRWGGMGFAVTDEEVWAAQRMLMEQEGIYAEPAGAAALAGMLQAIEKGRIAASEASVCLVTGHGFKDPDAAAVAAAYHPAVSIEASRLRETLG
jgi:threonine synthase